MSWVDVCGVGDVTVDRGVCALVGGRPVAVFRCSPVAGGSPGEWFAVDNTDPFSGASVLSRGLVGSVGDLPVVASPLRKQRFDLITGMCVDDDRVQIQVWEVRVLRGRVQVRDKDSRPGNPRETASKHRPVTIGG